jgi:TolB protein
MLKVQRTISASLLAIVVFCAPAARAFQGGKIIVELNMGQERPRLASPDFKPANADPQTNPLNGLFNQTLWYDLENAGIFDLVAKSFYPSQVPGQPSELQIQAWGNPPPNAGLVAFGNLGVNSGKVDVQGWLYDVKNQGAPPILAKQYREDATPDNARLIAHRFADEIISRLGGGIPALPKARFTSSARAAGPKRSGPWIMTAPASNNSRT